jgi:hypothetical protein
MWRLPFDELLRQKQLNVIRTEHRMWLNHLFGWETVVNNPNLYKLTYLQIERLLLLKIESARMAKVRKQQEELSQERALLEKLKQG